MSKFDIDFYANKLRGEAPCNIKFNCFITIPTPQTLNWRDTTDSLINLKQDGITGLSYQDGDN